MFSKARVLTISALLLALSSCTSNEKQGGKPQNTVIPSVEAVQTRFGSLPLEERISGTVVAENQVDVYPEISGVVEKVLVQNGDRVRAGQELLRLRSLDYQERVKQAQAGLDIARARAEQAEARVVQLQAQFDRMRTLAAQNLSSQAEIDNITAQLASAKADLSLAQAQVTQSQSSLDEANLNLSRTVVRSPVEGLVGQRMVEPGQLVNGNSRLFTVGNPSSVKVSVVLTERMMGYIREGMNVQIGSPTFPDSSVRATLTRISPFLDPISHTTTADIEVKNTGGFLIPGMFVTVDIFYGQSQNATLVPNSAVYRHPITGLTGVYVAKSIGSEVQPVNDVDTDSPPPLTEATPVEFVEVEVLAKGRQMSGIRGLNSGDWVVTVGQNLLAGGAQQARVRTVGWDRILDLQNLTEEGLLESVLKRNSAGDGDNRSM